MESNWQTELPSAAGEYLVTCRLFSETALSIRILYFDREKGYWCDYNYIYKVAAWMPLPEVYSEPSETGINDKKGENS